MMYIFYVVKGHSSHYLFNLCKKIIYRTTHNDKQLCSYRCYKEFKSPMGDEWRESEHEYLSGTDIICSSIHYQSTVGHSDCYCMVIRFTATYGFSA
jgi:hypothetical protein